jgi:hypothetical protein
MWRNNFDSVISRSSEGLDPAKWIRPYEGGNADPALVARYNALGKLPQKSFGKALWDFDKRNGYPLRAIRRRSTPPSERRTIRRA